MEPEDYELLHDYLWGRLEPAAREALEARLAVDSELQEALDHERLLCKAVQSMGDIRLKAGLRDEEDFLRSEARLRPVWTRLKFAASILLLAAFAFVLYQQFDPGSSDNLLATYFEPYPNLISPLNRAEDPETELAQAMANYERGAYNTAIPELDRLRSTSGDLNVGFYQGVALLATDQYRAALPHFQAIPSSHRLYWEAHWYQALCQIGRGDKASAKTALQRLIDEGDYQQQRARELLETLGS